MFASYITDVARVQAQLGVPVLESIRLSDTRVFIGLLLGGALPWMFASLSIKAVSRAAGQIVEEVRRQFKVPGVMEGTRTPDYARVVGISTASAQKELIPLATISVVVPLFVGLVLQVEALGGFLAGIILSGQLLAVFMSNAGGAWDNAKKSIEDEPRDLAKNTGKGSERHKAGVVGDTVGDPLKDTAGPALNPMIKVANLVSLIAAPIIVRYNITNADGTINIIVVAVAVLAAGCDDLGAACLWQRSPYAVITRVYRLDLTGPASVTCQVFLLPLTLDEAGVQCEYVHGVSLRSDLSPAFSARSCGRP